MEKKFEEKQKPIQEKKVEKKPEEMNEDELRSISGGAGRSMNVKAPKIPSQKLRGDN